MDLPDPSPDDTRPLISIVVPVYFNEEDLPLTWPAIRDALTPLQAEYRWEVVFVDDGSGDASYQRLMDIIASDAGRIRVVKLSRNFGQPVAMNAGLSHADGDCAVVISADLQDPPELIGELVARWRRGERKIVLATRERREDGWLAQVTSRIFYRLMRRYAVANMPEGGFDFFLIDRRVIDLMTATEEKNTFIQGQILWTGFEPDVIPYTRRRRTVGRSRWTLSMKIKYFVDGFVTYTVAPIRLITLVGLVVSALSFAYAGVIFLAKLFWHIPVKGWAPLMIVLLTLSGLHLTLLGLVGEYLWRVYHETRKLPLFIVDRVVGGVASDATDRSSDS